MIHAKAAFTTIIQNKKEEKENKKDKKDKNTTKEEIKTYADIVKGKEKAALGSVNQEETDSKGNWILDSGCTDHMVGSKEFMKKFKPKVTSVSIANNEIIKTTGFGQIVCSTKDKNIVLNNVWHVPKLGRNLLSVSAITKEGFQVQFQDK